MDYIYLVRSEKGKGFYISYISDLGNRIRDHTEGQVESTRNRRPLKLIYNEAYATESQAQLREGKLNDFGFA
jgi:putative endonuclease